MHPKISARSTRTPDRRNSISNWHGIEKTERERQHEQYENGTIGGQPGDQQQALDAQVGGPRPEYDQYELNQSGNINAQSEAQSFDSSPDADAQFEQQGDMPSSPQEERIDAERAIPGEISEDLDERLAADANRPLGKS